MNAGNRTNGDDGAEGGTGTEDRVHGVSVKQSTLLDDDRFLTWPQHSEPTAFNISFETMITDLQASDKLILNDYMYFKRNLLVVWKL